jgi:hypothetical protein
MNKLFVNQDVMCPVTFSTNIPVQFKGLYRIRIHAFYSDRRHTDKRVRRCRNDSQQDPEAEPLMRCTQPRAERESRDGHHMILVPLDEEKNDHLVQWTNLTFGCLSTCESIKKQKKYLMLNFRLETLE